ncbi:MAG TPA: TetR/AcrR family transcriptional regulator [Thermomicrobiales bacterium]|nr:TetR/AcrR family transcriptional regulator [Thermomicrobiales bacterium]
MSGKRPRGRPVVFETEDVFRTASLLLLDEGISKLSLLELARRVGTSRQALGKRFSSRDGFMLAYADWLRDIILDDAHHVIESTASPLEAARILWTMPINPRVTGVDDPSRREVAWWLGMQLYREPIIHKRNKVPDRELEILLRQLVVRAQEAGELVPADPDDIVEGVWVAVTGAVVNWTFQPIEDLVAKMTRCRERALAPYLPEPATSDRLSEE